PTHRPGAAAGAGYPGRSGRSRRHRAERPAGRRPRAGSVAHRARHGGPIGAVGRRSRSSQGGARRRDGPVSGRRRGPHLRRQASLGRLQPGARAGGVADGGLVREARRVTPTLARVRDALEPRTPTLPPVVVRPFVFALPSRPALVPGAEVQRAFWLPLARLSRPDARRDLTLAVRGVERTFPAYVIEGEVIWGMTERILTPFLQLIL